MLLFDDAKTPNEPCIDVKGPAEFLRLILCPLMLFASISSFTTGFVTPIPTFPVGVILTFSVLPECNLISLGVCINIGISSFVYTNPYPLEEPMFKVPGIPGPVASAVTNAYPGFLTCNLEAGVVVPTPTLVPSSYISESPRLVVPVNLGI